MVTFLNKFFVDKLFILYFYISNSVTYDFYITLFLNLIAVFYFLLMLYVLNFIAFLRNNFFNDLRILKLVGYFLGLSMRQDSDRFKRMSGLLAYYGYMVLTALEIFIKSSFLFVIGYFITKAPFISFDPAPTSSWKFADFFSKSRFYSYRPWVLSSSYTYRGFGSGNFPSEGAWIADDNDVVEAYYPRFLPHSKDFDHEDIFLRPGGVGLRLRTRARALVKFDIIGRNSVNWTRHLLGSKTDRGPIKKISAPWHRLERSKLYFSRSKSLELKPSLHESFSYYRSEDDCYSISIKKGFLSRLYVPGFGSKARKVLIYIPSEVEQDNVIFNGREMSATGVGKRFNNIIEVQPYERLLIREAKANNTKYDPTKDIYKDYRERDFERASSILQSSWLDYIESIKSLGVDNPTNYLSARRFSKAYNELNSTVKKYGSAASGYEFPNKESTVLDNEELTLIRYFRYLTNEPSGAEQVSLNGRYNLFLNRNTPFRNVDVRGEESSLYTYSFDNKFSFIHNLRGKHIYRRSLLDFVNVHILDRLRSFSNFTDFGIKPGGTNPRNSALDTNASEDLFGFMINDRKKFYKKVFKHGITDEDNRPLQLRGRESFDLNYATTGSSLRYFFGDYPFKARERVPKNSFIDRDTSKHKDESFFFNKASFDRRKVNTGVYVHKKLRSEAGLFSGDKDIYDVGNVGFLNQYARVIYQFMLDHFTYWLRIIFSYMNRNMDIPHFPSPASDIADKPVGLNPYVIFFKTFYFFRKCFRAVLFDPLSSKPASVLRQGSDISEYSGLSPLVLDETSDFTLLALRKTIFSYFARFLSLMLILALNTLLAGLNGIFTFTLNHITASIFLAFLAIVSLFRVKHLYEFDFSKAPPKFKGSLGSSLSRIFRKVGRAVKAPFSVILKSIDVLARFFTTGNLYPFRKPKESVELYYERLAKEQQTVVNILSFFKVDKIRKLLSRFGFLKFRNKADFKGYEKSIFRILLESFYKKQFNYKKVSLPRSGLPFRVRNWFRLSELFNKSVAHKRLSKFVGERYKIAPNLKVKEKIVYFSFKPTKEFLLIVHYFKAVLNMLVTLILRVKQFVGWTRASSKRIFRGWRKSKKLKNTFLKLINFFTRIFGNGLNFVKWKVAEWINK